MTLRFMRCFAAAAMTGSVLVLSVPAAHSAPPEVAVSVSPSTASPGDTVTVTETLTNVHPFTILQPYARILSRPGVLASYTTLTGCSGTIASCGTFSDSSGPVGFQGPVGSLSGGASATVVFTLKISPTAPGGDQILQGQLFGSNYATFPIDGPTLTILTQADVAVGLTATPRLGIVVPDIEFQVTAKNLGPATLQTATITTALPTGLSATSTDCEPGTGNVACTFQNVPNGSAGSAKFDVPLHLLTVGVPFTFTAHRTSSTPQDPNPANDTASVRCTVLTPLVVNCS